MDFLTNEVLWVALTFGLGVVGFRYKVHRDRKTDRAEAEATKPTLPQPSRRPTHMLGTMPRATDVLGRDGMPEQIHIALRNRKRTVVAAGQGGIGKTTLARHYVARFADRYDGIIWVRAEDDTTLADDLSGIAVALKLTGLDDAKPEQKARAALNALPADQDWLIVYDNVVDPKRLAGWWPVSDRARVLVTSRSREWDASVEVVAPEVLATDAPGDPGPQLLMREAGRRDDAAGARALAEALGGLPLALVAAGGLIRDAGGSFAEYGEKLERVLAVAPAGDYPISVIVAVKLSYDALDADARLVLDLFAWVAPEGLDAGLLTDVPGGGRIEDAADHLPDELMILCADPARVAAALVALVRRSLLVREGAGYSLHRMTAAAGRVLKGQAGRRDAVARQAAAVLAAAYPAKASVSENWPACARLTPHVLALHRVWPLASDDRLTSAAADFLFNQASIYLGEMAEFAPALALAEASLDLKRAQLPDSHRSIAIGWSILGEAYLDARRLEEAVAAQAENVRLSEAHDHGAADTATAHNNYAAALHALGEVRGDWVLVEQARDADTAALALRLEAFGVESEEVANSRANLAVGHAALGDLPAALDESTQALAIRRRVLPRGDARLGYSLTNTGSFHLRLGQAGAARPLLAEALDLRRAAYGRDDHPHVVDSASWLVACHLVLARRDPGQEAEARRIAGAFGLDWAFMQEDNVRFPDPVD